MQSPEPLDYESRPPETRGLHPATRAAMVLVALGFLSSLILLSGIRPLVVAVNATGCALAVWGLTRPRLPRSERIALCVTLAVGALAVL